MSDITIPGVTSKFNSDKIIEGLLKIERIPIDRLKERNTLNNTKKKIWQDLNRKVTTFRDSAKKLYSFQNPFEDKNAESSDSSVLTATATRDAEVEKRDIKIIKTAKADKFISRPVDKDFKLKSGKYVFTVGESEISINYKGGSLKNFSKIVNKEGSDILKSSLIRVDRDNVYFVLESKKTGSENRLFFDKEALSFAEKTGILEKKMTSRRDIIPDPDGINLKQWIKPVADGSYSVQDKILSLKPGSELSIPLSPSAPADEKLVLEMKVKITNISETEYKPPTPPSGPDIPESGSLTYKDITIKNGPFSISLPEWKTPLPPEKIDDMSVLFVSAGGTINNLPLLEDTEEEQIIRVPLSDFTGNLDALNFRNRNTHRIINISEIKIFNPEERGDYSPVNAASNAADAELELDGIRITRGTNEIDDLIPGVTLNLKNESSSNIEINVKPDSENIKNAIISFVGSYNNLLTEIQILTRNSQDIIDEVDYFTDDEREKAAERLGILQGEITLTQIKSRLQRIMMDSYPWNDDNTLSMLAELGISTNSTGSGGVSASRLRGYMEINEDKLDKVIESEGEKLKNLFGTDTDNDLVVDSGLAYTADIYGKAYNQTGGIISLKISTIDKNIKRNDKDIENYDRKLEQTEQQLKRKYGMMEGALQEMEKSSKSIQNLNSNNSR